MAKEIERKFLVRDARWKDKAGPGSKLTQAYVAVMDDRNVRIRLSQDGSAKLTMKAGRAGLTRDEVEFSVPANEARELLELSIGNVIEKVRYVVPYEGFLWEIDVYEGDLDGLVVAEVELESENDDPAIPAWVGMELTGDAAYSNQSLALYGLPEIRAHARV
ncbi:CYTH domain-containing protein [Rhizobium sp. L1K21]|uniref:CYTH domain-containing protein n=1 Tax=Rhizobium sp. L1K21 TaxID=2954933 RepID=UPI002092E0CF|nr:CYTH domain-containing protein [Rhizobium sp. L1K21]MCO6184955.1 CYTH domain-containing protein [Rhizobium sp. L1K21]